LPELAVTTVGAFWLMQRIPFDPLGVLGDPRQLLFMPLYYLVVAVPFFCSGLALALLFTRGTTRVNRLYAFDLVGAGVGCAALAVVIPHVGGAGSVLVAAALGALSGAFFGIRERRTLATGCAVLCAFGLLLAPGADRRIPIRTTTAKFTPPFPPLYTAWNTFSRIQVFERPANPEQKTRAIRRIIFDGGTAATGLQDMRPGVREFLRDHPDDADYESGIAYVGRREPRVLIIGSGGGSEVLDALHFGAKAVTAVEINPIITDVVRSRMKDFWGGLFDEPEVHLVNEEGRSFVRRSKEKYDAIISVHTISNAAVASGALALSEDYVLTRNAVDDYLDHLAPGGALYFTRPEPQIPRLVATAREALSKVGIEDASAHVYVYRLPPDESEKETFGENRGAFLAGLLVKNAPFTAAEIDGIEALLGVDRASDGSSPEAEVLYSPMGEGSGTLYHSLLSTKDLPGLYRAHPRQIRPTTDDRPFFNHHTRWRSLDRTTVRALFSDKELGSILLGDRPVAEVSLLVLLAQTTLIGAALILLPLILNARKGWRAPHRFRFLLYFAALGFGFILIEIALLSQFTLFLGQPVYTFAVVLASLLVFTGIGASFSARYASEPRRALRRLLPLLVLVVLATAAIKPVVFGAALGLPLAARVAIAVAMLLPIGIVLGMPFPLGLRIVSEDAAPLVPWAWGVNGFCTVSGTVLALILGMTFGFTAVVLVGTIGYGLAAAVVPRAA
jgi:SAM-dependent methyltransferase